MHIDKKLNQFIYNKYITPKENVANPLLLYQNYPTAFTTITAIGRYLSLK